MFGIEIHIFEIKLTKTKGWLEVNQYLTINLDFDLSKNQIKMRIIFKTKTKTRFFLVRTIVEMDSWFHLCGKLEPKLR